MAIFVTSVNQTKLTFWTSSFSMDKNSAMSQWHHSKWHTALPLRKWPRQLQWKSDEVKERGIWRCVEIAGMIFTAYLPSFHHESQTQAAYNSSKKLQSHLLCWNLYHPTRPLTCDLWHNPIQDRQNLKFVMLIFVFKLLHDFGSPPPALQLPEILRISNSGCLYNLNTYCWNAKVLSRQFACGLTLTSLLVLEHRECCVTYYLWKPHKLHLHDRTIALNIFLFRASIAR